MGILKKFIYNYIYREKEKCFVCGKDIPLAEISNLCSDCLAKINYVNNYCEKCGRELIITEKLKDSFNKSTKNYKCDFCTNKEDEFYFKKSRSVFVFEDLGRELIFNYKYFSKKELYLPFGELLYIYFKEYYKNTDIDYIIPIPLYKNRKNERGYNQAALIAEVLAEKTKITYDNQTLIRDKKTPPLYDLNRNKRMALIKGVFGLKDKDKFRNKNLLLIDDIFTTGSTTNEISYLLKKRAEAKNVYILTLATAKVKLGKET